MVRLSNRSEFEQLLDRFEPEIANAFREAVDGIKSRVTLKALIERLECGDIEGALDVLNIERAAFGGLELVIADALNHGGRAFASEMKLRDVDGNRVQFNFGVRNTPAEDWLREHSSTLVTRITADQQQMVRTSLSDGLAQGQNPRTTALDIVGRVNRATGKREGGVLGLTSQQAEQLAEVKRILANPDEIRRFFIKDEKTGEWKPRYKTTPRKWDRQIIRAINDGRALASEDIGRISTVHANRLLQLRGEAIGFNETFTALSKARDEAMRQAIQAGKVVAEFVTKRWRHSGKAHPRVQHVRMNGKEVGYLEDFVLPDGTRMAHPHAPGAPAEHTIFCGCYAEYRVDYTAQLLSRRRAA